MYRRWSSNTKIVRLYGLTRVAQASGLRDHPENGATPCPRMNAKSTTSSGT